MRPTDNPGLRTKPFNSRNRRQKLRAFPVVRPVRLMRPKRRAALTIAVRRVSGAPFVRE